MVTPRIQERSVNCSAGAGWLRQVAWLPVPLYLFATVALWVVDQRAVYESAYLLMSLNLVFGVLASALIVYLVSRSFLASHEPGLLLLGCGVGFWGAAGLAGVVFGLIAVRGPLDINRYVTIHNTLSCLSAACHLAGAILFTRDGRRQVAGVWLPAAYTATLGVAGLIVLAAEAGWMPTFFVQGLGGTLARDWVLGSAVAMFAMSATLLRVGRRPLTVFRDWYSLALALITVGLFGILIETFHASAVSWTGRSAQFLGGVYMLMAAMASARESGSWRMPIEEALRESEERYRSIFDNAAVGIVTTEVETGRILSANPAFQEMLGYTAEELSDKTTADITYPGDMETDIEQVRRVKEGQATHFHVEKRYLRKDGGVVWGHLSGSIVYSQDGKQLYGIGTVEDITERKSAEEALRRSRQDLDRAQEVGQIGWWRLDTRRNVLTWSDESYRIFGVPKDTPMSYESFLEIVHPDDREYVDACWSAGLRGEPYDIEHRLLIGDQVKWVREKAYLEFGDEGDVLGGFGITQDITAKKDAEQALALAHAEAEGRAAQLESFLASAVDAVVLHDAQGNKVLANGAAYTILGPHIEDLLEERTEQFRTRWLDGTPVRPEDTASGRALRGETVKDQRYVITSGDGRDKVISVSSSPVLSANGTVLGATTVFRDVTDQAEFERQREELLEREHRIADLLQQAIVPPAVPSEMLGYDIAVRYKAALREADVGGDFYDVFELADGRLAVLIGDVAGKGLTAALRVAAARHAIRNYAYVDPRPGQVITLANEALCKDGEDSQILTAFLAVLDPEGGTMVYCSAGHEPPVACRANGLSEELSETGLPLGLLSGATYSESTRPFGPGDMVVLVTDGITEARRPPSDLFGRERLTEYLQAHVSKPVDEIASGLLDAATAHADGHLQDDAAVVVFAAQPRKGHG
jgi:PAS domain S-box-containing protein